MKKEQCQSIAKSTNKQCEKTSLLGAPYCWLHYPKKETIEFFVLGVLLTFLFQVVFEQLNISPEEQKINELQQQVKNLSNQNQELINGKNQLLLKIEEYQNDLKNKQTRIEELEKKSNTIQSLELHVSVNIITPESTITEQRTSTGLSSVIALFSENKTRYRFVTDFQWAEQQISLTIKQLKFIYKIENPLQILGKQIDFLKTIDKFACNYQDFLEKIKVNDDLGGTIDMIVFLNGIDVITSQGLTFNPGVLSEGQAELNISNDFEVIPKKYIAKINEKSI